MPPPLFCCGAWPALACRQTTPLRLGRTRRRGAARAYLKHATLPLRMPAQVRDKSDNRNALTFTLTPRRIAAPAGGSAIPRGTAASKFAPRRRTAFCCSLRTAASALAPRAHLKSIPRHYGVPITAPHMPAFY